jgi:ATP-dependent exoDNAse (exonuclease V) beta subunit
MEARRDAGGKAYTLAINRRSGPRLIAAVNTLFTQARVPFVFDGIEFFPAQAAPGASETLGGTAGAEAPLQILLARPRDGKRTINDRGSTL